MRRVFTALKQLGPALVLAAVVLGPGSITLSTIAGSLYGYQLLWVPLISTFFMLVFTWMSAKIGLVSDHTFFSLTRNEYGAGISKLGGIFSFLAILAFQSGNMAAIGFAFEAITGLDARLSALLFVAIAVGLLFFRNIYRIIEYFVKIVVGIMIVTFVGTLWVVGVDWTAFLQGLRPGFPDPEAIFLGLGMAGTTFPVVAAVYQSYLMREKRWGPENLREEGVDSFFGIGILGSMAVVILLTSAGVIHGTGEPVFSAQGMARQLEPLAGPTAFYLFISGFFFASLSSMVVNPVIGATLLTDSFGLESSMSGKPVRIWTIVGLLFGLIIVLIFQTSPIEILRVAQGMTVIAFPVVGALILLLSGKKHNLGAYSNSRLMTGLGIVGYVTILGIVGYYIIVIFEIIFS
ncbi:MAG: hypothetical protein GF372_02730 [Candidatus Marinimicrobia bacterium]|nr:hypothetical protein [Candidatus Neomarinimicrobiota bacterium]